MPRWPVHRNYTKVTYCERLQEASTHKPRECQVLDRSVDFLSLDDCTLSMLWPRSTFENRIHSKAKLKVKVMQWHQQPLVLGMPSSSLLCRTLQVDSPPPPTKAKFLHELTKRALPCSWSSFIVGEREFVWHTLPRGTAIVSSIVNATMLISSLIHQSILNPPVADGMANHDKPFWHKASRAFTDNTEIRHTSEWRTCLVQSFSLADQIRSWRSNQERTD